VGDSGVIIHWDGGKWSLVESPTSKRLNAVYFVSSDDGWAVGNSGTILHWNGSVWRIENSPVVVNLKDIQLTTQNTGWVVGDLAQYFAMMGKIG
jgi:photosystem II stability/assembly factor-like uncharacterized protein